MRNTYVVTDESGREVFRGYVEELREQFGLGKQTTITYYLKEGRRLKWKYHVSVVESRVPPKPSAYRDLLDKQIQLLRLYDSVLAYSKDVERNMQDLRNCGFKMEKRQVVHKDGRGRPVKYWILEKA